MSNKIILQYLTVSHGKFPFKVVNIDFSIFTMLMKKAPKFLLRYPVANIFYQFFPKASIQIIYKMHITICYIMYILYKILCFINMLENLHRKKMSST